MDFDFFQITGKWNAAKVTRRADKLEEAERAADELERGGASNVEIIGVKAGKREKIRGQRKPAKPAKKKAPAKTRAKKKTPPKRTKAAKDKVSKLSKDDLNAIDSIFSRDGRIKILSIDKPKEPRGQLDLFGVDENKKVVIRFSNIELATLINDYYDLIQSGERLTGYKALLTTFEKATPRERIEFTKKEIKSIIGVLQKYMKKHITEKTDSSIYGQTKDLKDTLIKAFYNV